MPTATESQIVTTPKQAPDLSTIKTISFDGDGTLWDFESAMHSALELTLTQLRLLAKNDKTQQLTVQKMIAIRDFVASELGEATVPLEQIRYAAFVKTLEYVGSPSMAIARELHQLYLEARTAGIKPYSDVPAALEELKSRYKIGMISNGNTLPETVGMPDIFQFTVFANDYGFAKPDPRIFEFALARSGSRPEHVLHVGDSLESDVHGANTSGLHSAWLNRDAMTNDTDIRPDLEIIDFTELLGFL